MIYFTFFTFQMYSSSLRFQQKEPKNHPNGMNDHKNVERDHASKQAKFSQYHTFVTIQEWLRYTIFIFS